MASVPEGTKLFNVRVERGGPWDWSKELRAGAVDGARALHELARRRRPHRPGLPLEGGRDAFHVVDSPSEEAMRARFAEDPWAKNGMLKVTNVERWTILLAPED